MRLRTRERRRGGGDDSQRYRRRIRHVKGQESGSRGRKYAVPKCVAAGVTVQVKHAVGGAAAVSAVALLWCYRTAKTRDDRRGDGRHVGGVMDEEWPRKLVAHVGSMWDSVGTVLRRNERALNALQQGRGGVAATYFKPISSADIPGDDDADAEGRGGVRGSTSDADTTSDQERWDDSGHGVTWLVMERLELAQVRSGAKAVLKGVWREIAKLWMVVEGAGIVVNLVYSLNFKSGGTNWKDEERTQTALNVGMGKSRTNRASSIGDGIDASSISMSTTAQQQKRNRRVSLKDAESFASVRTCARAQFECMLLMLMTRICDIIP